MNSEISPSVWQVAKKQLVAMSLFLLLFLLVSLVLYINDRQQEWRLRREQAVHQLELAFQLLDRDIERVRSDVLLVAKQGFVQRFRADDEQSRAAVEYEFRNFLESQKTFQQIRLLDLKGKEAIRVDWRQAAAEVVARSELQDKQDRYYYRESLRLKPGEVFVSEFDLNQEHGKIEQPLSPVIRFATPVTNPQGEIRFLLVANYLGAPLLEDLATTSLPGQVFLTREDGHYLLGPTAADAWGWLLHHTRSFDRQFADAWNQRLDAGAECYLNSQGAFAFRSIQTSDAVEAGDPDHSQLPAASQASSRRRTLWVVSYLPTAKVFEASRQLLNRLIVLLATILLPLIVLTRVWAYASVRRRQQTDRIQHSEKKLRELSARLVRIQEEERKSISREIHDQLGQQATAINLDLKLAAQQLDPERVNAQINRAIEESECLLETLHDFASRVRPVELDDLGLFDAIASFLTGFEHRTGIETVFETNLDQAQLPAELAGNVFRLVQESLNNVVKHAQATRVEVSIRLEGEGSDRRLQLQVRDDGIGAAENQELSSSGSRLGILGMRERVDLLGGTFDWQSEPSAGTTVDVMIPANWVNRSESKPSSIGS